MNMIAKHIDDSERSVLLMGASNRDAARIATLIQELTEQRDALYDRAYPIGGFGRCKDEAALDACGKIDLKIRELHHTKADLLAGKVEEPPPTPQPAQAQQGISGRETAMLEGVIDALLDGAIAPILKRMDELEKKFGGFKQITDSYNKLLYDHQQRIGEIESEPRLRYEGVWADAREYSPGMCVTDNGSLWVARATSTNVRPGTPSTTCWTLAVKKGKDADR